MNFNAADGKMIQINAVCFSQLNGKSNKHTNAHLFHQEHESNHPVLPGPAIVSEFVWNMFPWMRQGGGGFLYLSTSQTHGALGQSQRHRRAGGDISAPCALVFCSAAERQHCLFNARRGQGSLYCICKVSGGGRARLTAFLLQTAGSCHLHRVQLSLPANNR